MPVTRTYLVDQDLYLALVSPARALGLMDHGIFLVGGEDWCLVRCRSEAEAPLVYMLLTAPEHPWRVALVDGQIIAPSIWRDEVQDAITASPYADLAQVLAVVDLSLSTPDDHDRLIEAVRSQGYYVEMHRSEDALIKLDQPETAPVSLHQ